MKRSGGAALAVLALAAHALPSSAQAPGAGEGVRFGISFGGISTVSLAVELFDDTHALEAAVGTWSFRDLALSVVVKEYFGASSARPYVGAGLWSVIASEEGGRPGVALVVRAPVGVDWAFADDHAVGAAININRALWVRRSDPLDDLPMNERFVPLPEVHYRVTS